MRHLPLLAVVALLGCDDGDPAATMDAAPIPDAQVADAADFAVADAALVPDVAAPDAFVEPDARVFPDAQMWAPRPRPEGTDGLEPPAGWRWARGLIHMHSPLSHDACDGDPMPGGEYDLDCLADLRHGMCFDRHDFVFLTDHEGSFGEEPTLEAGLWLQDGDEAIAGPDGPVGTRWACPGEDHTVLLTAGFESDLMPVMLTRKPARALHSGDDAETADALRDHGALVLQAHIEDRDLEQLRSIGLDGLEVYNLHANIDPRGHYWNEVVAGIRDWLPAGFDGGHPDLAFLAIIRPITPSVDTWDALLPTQRLTGFAGSDIHQNTNILPTHDGERLDSYRRMGSWFSNYLLVRDTTLPELRDALAAGRVAIVFDLLGRPTGLDYAAHTAAGERVEMGAATALDPGTTLRFTVASEDPLAVRLFRVDVDGRALVLETDGPFEHTPQQPGAYRVEVDRTPQSLAPELGEVAETFVRPTIWLYTNPVYVE